MNNAESIRETNRGEAIGKNAEAPLSRTANPATVLRTLKAELTPISALKTCDTNARVHSARQIGKLASAIRNMGVMNPILIDEAGNVLAGHGRLAAAKRLKLQLVPTVRVFDLSDDQKRAYRIADNRMSELSTWDEQVLKVELTALGAIPDISVEVVGFSADDIFPAAKAPKRKRSKFISACSSICHPGDEWQLGPHRLICAESELGLADDIIAGFEAVSGVKATLAASSKSAVSPLQDARFGTPVVQPQSLAITNGGDQ